MSHNKSSWELHDGEGFLNDILAVIGKMLNGPWIEKGVSQKMLAKNFDFVDVLSFCGESTIYL